MVRVLIVDDNRFSRRMLQKYVKELGHATLETENGLMALEMIDQNANIDIIFTDLLMPDMNGLELLSALRDRGFSKPVVVISADIQEDTRKEVENLGAACFINKPFTAQDIEDILERAMQIL